LKKGLNREETQDYAGLLGDIERLIRPVQDDVVHGEASRKSTKANDHNRKKRSKGKKARRAKKMSMRATV